MRKVALIALFTTATALGSYAVAQTAPGPALPAPSTSGDVQPLPEAARPRGPFQQLTRADMDALTDARVAAIQAGLKLNPEQQKLWPALELAIRANAAHRAARIERMRSGERPTPPADLMERLDRRADRLSQRAQRMTALQAALKPLWASFDERQKRLFPILMRAGGGGRHTAWAEGWRGGPDRMGPGGMERMRERMGRGGMGQEGMGRHRMDRDRMGPGERRGGPGRDGPPKPEL
jgi:zinc resistance-associated protein